MVQVLCVVDAMVITYRISTGGGFKLLLGVWTGEFMACQRGGEEFLSSLTLAIIRVEYLGL